MKNAKKILSFLGAISLVAFGSFNMTGNKSNKNTVAESKETETDKRKIKKLMQWQWQWKITDRHKIHRKLSR